MGVKEQYFLWLQVIDGRVIDGYVCTCLACTLYVHDELAMPISQTLPTEDSTRDFPIWTLVVIPQ